MPLPTSKKKWVEPARSRFSNSTVTGKPATFWYHSTVVRTSRQISAAWWMPLPEDVGRFSSENRNSSRMRSRASVRRCRSSSLINDVFSALTGPP